MAAMIRRTVTSVYGSSVHFDFWDDGDVTIDLEDARGTDAVLNGQVIANLLAKHGIFCNDQFREDTYRLEFRVLGNDGVTYGDWQVERKHGVPQEAVSFVCAEGWMTHGLSAIQKRVVRLTDGAVIAMSMPQRDTDTVGPWGA